MNTNITTEEIKKTKNEYFRTWRKNNRDKVRQAQQRYWEKVAKEKQRKSRM